MVVTYRSKVVLLKSFTRHSVKNSSAYASSIECAVYFVVTFYDCTNSSLALIARLLPPRDFVVLRSPRVCLHNRGADIFTRSDFASAEVQILYSCPVSILLCAADNCRTAAEDDCK